jgi:hypothetical protein
LDAAAATPPFCVPSTAADSLAARQKSDPTKLAPGACLRQQTTLSVKQIAERLRLGKPKGARTNLHAFRTHKKRTEALASVPI